MGIVHVGVGHYIASFQRLKKNPLLEDNFLEHLLNPLLFYSAKVYNVILTED